MEGRSDVLAELKQILRVRTPLYEQAELHLDTETLGQQGTVESLVSYVQEGGFQCPL